MKRREFIVLIGGGAAAWPAFAAGATIRQDTTNWRVDGGSRERSASTVPPCRLPGGTPNTWLDEHRHGNALLATSDAETVRRYAKELVALQPDLLLSQSTNTTDALLQQTRVIPIIFALVSDPVGNGFVASFPRTGGNVTGFTISEPTMGGKWIELLKKLRECIGSSSRITLQPYPACPLSIIT